MTSPDSLFIVDRAERHGERVAAIAAQEAVTYNQLLDMSARLAAALLAQRDDLGEARVAFLLPPGIPWIVTLWGIWRAGGVAVPLPLSAARPELEYFLRDSGASAVIFDSATGALLEPIAAEIGIGAWSYDRMTAREQAALPRVAEGRHAMILYTSGTTSRPKGVVTTHANIAAQILTLVEAWEWRQTIALFCVCRLHHIHGIINVVSCALWSGATCEIMPRFDANAVWDRIASGSHYLIHGGADDLCYV